MVPLALECTDLFVWGWHPRIPHLPLLQPTQDPVPYPAGYCSGNSSGTSLHQRLRGRPVEGPLQWKTVYSIRHTGAVLTGRTLTPVLVVAPVHYREVGNYNVVPGGTRTPRSARRPPASRSWANGPRLLRAVAQVGGGWGPRGGAVGFIGGYLCNARRVPQQS